jgi:hypothetical protein
MTFYLLFFSFADFSALLVDGFFDAGMLLQALKAKDEGQAPTIEKDVMKRNIGRRLKLAEY